MKYCTRPASPQRPHSRVGHSLIMYRREARAAPLPSIRPGLHRIRRRELLPGSIIGRIIGPKHLATTASIGAAVVSGVTTANVSALTAIVIRLALGQFHRTGRLPAVIAIVPVVWLENHVRAPRYAVRLSKLAHSPAESNTRPAIAPRPGHESRRARLPKRLVSASAPRLE